MTGCGKKSYLWQTMAKYGVSGRLLKAVKALYENSEARVRVEGELTDCDRE